ncbi:MAG: hypothetical protein ACR2K9_00005 [Solirubrobacteraceae bacterium]
MKRSILAALLCGLCFALPSQALEPVPYRVSVGVDPTSVELGSRVKVDGHVTSAGVAQPDVQVVLFVQRFPYGHSFRPVAARRTTSSGGFIFKRSFDRNTRVRVQISGSATRSRVAEADVVPRTHLSDHVSRDLRKVRAVVTARSAPDVRLGGRVDIYVGRYKAQHLRKVSRPVIRPVSRGFARASALITIPASYNGGYNIVSCYVAPASAGMRERGFRCPKVATFSSASSATAASYKP